MGRPRMNMIIPTIILSPTRLKLSNKLIRSGRTYIGLPEILNRSLRNIGILLRRQQGGLFFSFFTFSLSSLASRLEGFCGLGHSEGMFCLMDTKIGMKKSIRELLEKIRSIIFSLM